MDSGKFESFLENTRGGVIAAVFRNRCELSFRSTVSNVFRGK